MTVLEPWRSRLWIAVGVLLAAAIILAPEFWTKVALGALGYAVMITGHIMQFISRTKRRRQFTVLRGTFLALPTVSPGLATLMSLILVGMLTGFVAFQQQAAGDESDPVVTGMLITLAVIAAAQAILAWPPLYVALTPQGMQWSSALHRRFVPWEALAPGGPPAPAPRIETVTLAVIRPEAVTVKGLRLFVGPLERPVVGYRFDVHPWLMAAAIRWYVEHPEDRAAIGTPEEHRRLLAAVGKPAAED